MTEVGRESNVERVQIENILRAAPNVRAHPPDWKTRPEGVDYLYRIDQVIARTPDLGAVQRELTTRKIRNSAEDGEFLTGLTRVHITVPAKEGEGGEGRLRRGLRRLTGRPKKVWSLAEQIQSVRGNLGTAAVSLDHVFYVCKVHSCAAIEPELTDGSTDPVPATQTFASQGEVVVRILDTGLVHTTTAALTWMSRVTGDPDTLVHKLPNQPGQFEITQDGGHGTFTAGCVGVAAPDAAVYVVNAAKLLRPEQETGEPEPETDELGAVCDIDLALLMRDEIENSGVQVMVVNFAGTTQDNVPPPSLAQLSAVIKDRDLVILAPVGNDGDARVTWPSKFDWVKSVGGLTDGAPLERASDQTRYQPGGPLTRAHWSNYGKVDVWAPGDLLMNGYATGSYQPTWNAPPTPPARKFNGMAVWSGTSFATPLVAGMIAARVSATPGLSVRDAWGQLLKLAEGQLVPYAGPSLLPSQALD
ncbi:hypothetical protein EKO23_06255 [Nocardioides guangzhouensis]|uniref:Peptidase S8/S53 domain-containing protein n=1 Tax=Nocardioides guangzhouensis TaxID=2497878 RepID=A0A4V1XZL9_9ACTN|nr:S8/S53 family peptidase [Nocardioides guangzhouensis]RYP87209.1 hypothetical protein EKO23_06255 [Nocardioides guangzhouensis]